MPPKVFIILIFLNWPSQLIHQYITPPKISYIQYSHMYMGCKHLHYLCLIDLNSQVHLDKCFMDYLQVKVINVLWRLQ